MTIWVIPLETPHAGRIFVSEPVKTKAPMRDRPKPTKSYGPVKVWKP